MCVVVHSVESMARQNCATILLHRQAAARKSKAAGGGCGRRFKCKSCDRAFETFQALGGHAASHKKLRLESGDAVRASRLSGPASKAAHECRECRVGFQTGQALGGHMRKHVAKRKIEDEKVVEIENKIDPLLFCKSSRVCFNFDLNFPPPLEDYSGFGFLQRAM